MIIVEVNHDDLDYVQRRLGEMGSQASKTLRDAVNISAQRARRMLEHKARERYTVKYAGLNSHIRITRATTSRLHATLTVKGRPLTMPRFHIAKPTKDTGVQVEVIRGSGLKEWINHAGNKAFMGSKNGMAMVWQRKRKKRYPLRAGHGPGVAKMLEKVYAGGRITDSGLRAEIERMYHENVEAAIERTLNKK